MYCDIFVPPVFCLTHADFLLFPVKIRLQSIAIMNHYCNRLVRWQLHNIQPLRTFFQSGNVKNALRLYITCIETQGENSNCAVPLYFTRNPCAPHRPVTADDRLCLLEYSKTLLSTGCSRTSSAASFRCLTPSGSSL